MIISAKYRRKTLSGLEPSFLCDASLSFFLLWLAVYVCAALLWGQEGVVHCRVTGCSVCSPDPLSPAFSSLEALDEIELLDSWQLAVWQYGWGCDTPDTLSESPSTELTLPSIELTLLSLHHYSVSTVSSDILLGCRNCVLFLGRLIMPPLTPTLNCILGRITSSLYDTGYKLSPKSEKRNAILLSCKWDPSKKRIADKGLLIAACHHIIAVTLVLHRYTLQTKQSHTSQMNRSVKISIASSPLYPYCCRYKQPHIKNG